MKEKEVDRPNLIPDKNNPSISRIHTDSGKPITVIGNRKIREGFDQTCLEQAISSRHCPGVTDLVLGADGHAGYGAPIGCIMASPTHIYPGPVGFDIKCSMSLLQTDIPTEEIKDKKLRRAVINAICDRVPTGVGKGRRHVKKSKEMTTGKAKLAAVYGASEYVLQLFGLPETWIDKCEDAIHGVAEDLNWRYDHFDLNTRNILDSKLQQLGSLGSGNHFLEANTTKLVGQDAASQLAQTTFGLKEGCISILTHCGSRGFGHALANMHFKSLAAHFNKWHIPFPAGDRELVYAPLDSVEGKNYLMDMSLAANFATVNHLLINSLILEAFQEVIPGCKGDLVYYISHNMAREEIVNSKKTWIHRKGATRAFPANHHALKETPFYLTGHPILLPGDPVSGSAVMVAQEGAKNSLYSINHGAGRALGRKAAKRTLNQAEVDTSMADNDIMTNCRKYPLDESPDAYKDFNQVTASVEEAGLAKTVARLTAKGGFVIKDEK